MMMDSERLRLTISDLAKIDQPLSITESALGHLSDALDDCRVLLTALREALTALREALNSCDGP